MLQERQEGSEGLWGWGDAGLGRRLMSGGKTSAPREWGRGCMGQEQAVEWGRGLQHMLKVPSHLVASSSARCRASSPPSKSVGTRQGYAT